MFSEAQARHKARLDEPNGLIGATPCCTAAITPSVWRCALQSAALQLRAVRLHISASGPTLVSVVRKNCTSCNLQIANGNDEESSSLPKIVDGQSIAESTHWTRRIRQCSRAPWPELPTYTPPQRVTRHQPSSGWMSNHLGTYPLIHMHLRVHIKCNRHQVLQIPSLQSSAHLLPKK